MLSSSSVSSGASTGSSLREQARAVLRQAFATEQGWIRVHAAEAMVDVGDGAMAQDTILRELAMWEASPHRTGAWRTLAFAAMSEAERAPCIAKIESVLAVEGAADRLQSLESLCKLEVAVSGIPLLRARAMAAGPEGEKPLGNWALVLAGECGALTRLGALVVSADPLVRLRAAYALRWLRPTDATVLGQLAAVVEAEPADSQAYPYLVSAALASNASPARIAAWKAAAAKILAEGVTGARYEICQTLALRGEPVEAALVTPLLEHKDGDARIGAAWLLLSVPVR